HDCVQSGCNEIQLETVMKEREISIHKKRTVKHNDSVHFIVNTQSLHNNQHIVRSLPLHLQQ
ncbi:hypothetical protein BDV93DRAFT_397721, partial [Ceratobasidium sp. AG-I]